MAPLNTKGNYLKQSITDRYSIFYFNRYFPSDSFCNLFETNEANRLLLKFLPEADFFDHHCFKNFQVEDTPFQKFKGAFYCSTLPLVFRLYLLEDILQRASQHGVAAFPPWMRLFRSFYNRTLITRRNIEMSGYLHLSQYLKKQSSYNIKKSFL